ncbi:hypothetical protein BDV25DRAFT_160701 [Aspergillus avenaceus]|uniref:Uncharacterized protein n=1 Tax=Aspergillus avenaceus TaxID=36643 RepID=A0A5N6TLS7_ASPAV|nr:hypothetical protein BDV25DRAFT_160701 [Aspergillus avenaceus]
MRTQAPGSTITPTLIATVSRCKGIHILLLSFLFLFFSFAHSRFHIFPSRIDFQDGDQLRSSIDGHDPIL